VPLAEKELGYQAGFQERKSTTDQIFSLRQILKKTYEYNIETHYLFVVFMAAYDTVKRSQLYEAMEEFGILRKLIRMTKITMMDSMMQVRVQSTLSQPSQSPLSLIMG
jgi:hypothetical protein